VNGKHNNTVMLEMPQALSGIQCLLNNGMDTG